VFRNILVAIDGSESAMAALAEAIELARGDGARLVLISVATPPRWRFSGFSYVPYPTEDDLVRAARDVVLRAEAVVPADVRVSSVVAVGPPAAAIVAQAEQGGHDLVVVGSRGLGHIGSLVLGSVSRAVTARSPVPVLVARRHKPASLALPAAEPRPQVHAESPPAGVHVQAEPSTKGHATMVLWLVAALLLELELVWWMFQRMYAP
jgi:nucleotide-binding universal stress UspA family protein